MFRFSDIAGFRPTPVGRQDASAGLGFGRLMEDRRQFDERLQLTADLASMSQEWQEELEATRRREKATDAERARLEREHEEYTKWRSAVAQAEDPEQLQALLDIARSRGATIEGTGADDSEPIKRGTPAAPPAQMDRPSLRFRQPIMPEDPGVIESAPEEPVRRSLDPEKSAPVEAPDPTPVATEADQANTEAALGTDDQELARFVDELLASLDAAPAPGQSPPTPPPPDGSRPPAPPEPPPYGGPHPAPAPPTAPPAPPPPPQMAMNPMPAPPVSPPGAPPPTGPRPAPPPPGPPPHNGPSPAPAPPLAPPTPPVPRMVANPPPAPQQAEMPTSPWEDTPEERKSAAAGDLQRMAKEAAELAKATGGTVSIERSGGPTPEGTPGTDPYRPTSSERALVVRDRHGNVMARIDSTKIAQRRLDEYDRWSTSVGTSLEGDTKDAWDAATSIVRPMNLTGTKAKEATLGVFEQLYSQQQQTLRTTIGTRNKGGGGPDRATDYYIKGQMRAEQQANKFGLQQYAKAQGAFSEVAKMLRSRNGVLDQQVITTIATQQESGRLTEGDIARAGGDPGVWLTMQNLLSKETANTVSEAQRARLAEALLALEKANFAKMRNAYKQAKSVSRANARHAHPQFGLGYDSYIDGLVENYIRLDKPDDAEKGSGAPSGGKAIEGFD